MGAAALGTYRVRMRRVLVHACLAAAVSCGADFVVGGPASATTVPDDTGATADTIPSDPGLEAALAVFEGRMAEAGLTNLGPAPSMGLGDGASEDEYAQCAPEVRDVIVSLEELGSVVTGHAVVTSDRFGPGPPTGTERATTTTVDPLTALFAGTEEVAATAQRLDESEIEAADQAIELLRSPDFAECLETVMASSASMGDVPAPDLSIPELSDLSIPDLSDLTMPTMPDMSMPELDVEIEVTPGADLGVGDASGGFSIAMSMVAFMPMDISVEAVIVRSGDALITVSHSRLNGTGEPMDVDLAAEAAAIVDAL